ncbi:exostosin family protein [Agromyces sp. H66]|uniref:exostosin domain-containing protein n=1 Tax=Agromyces sp. H66 TaxID=2529859 RepID=UPI00145ACB6C|nr:exostosin family protein [Agromyces sp. H66]
MSDAASADAILFTECHQLDDPITMTRIRGSAEFSAYRDRCYVFDQRPRAYCSLPGLYTSAPRSSFRPEYQVPWSYHKLNDDLAATGIPADLLVSFVGTARSHPCREQLLQLRHPRALIERVDGHVPWRPDAPGFHERRVSFAESLLRSSFVLCPRGRATSSIRFYETMVAGRVPVVFSDEWVAPQGVDLSEFAIVWPERNVDGLLDYLERHEERAAEMGRRARQLFEERFAPEVMFDRIGDALELLVATRPWQSFPKFGFMPDRRVFRHAAGIARKKAQRLGR